MNIEDSTKYQILKLIKDNIEVYSFDNDKCFKELKKYCRDNCEKYDGKLLSYDLLVKFTREVMIDLLNVEHLYDYFERDFDRYLPF